jgi:ribosome biogenesis GTPase
MKTLGFERYLEQLQSQPEFPREELARVIVEHKERYLVQNNQAVFKAEIIGNLRYSAISRKDFPAVGDWVRISMMDKDTAIIMEVLPRFNKLERKAVGKTSDIQIIAGNIDHAFIVQSVGHDFNLKRIERYLIICRSAGIDPIIILSKTDLVGSEELDSLLRDLTERVKGIKIIALSNINNSGIVELKKAMAPYETYCFLGSSGVGKSSIINNLMSEQVLKTNTISDSTSKGRHTTSHRELIVLRNKSIVIDTPGMREIGVTEVSMGIDLTFDEINELAQNCRYSDCKHIHEKGCAVMEALTNGEISQDVYDNYQKIKREQIHYSSSIKEKRQKSREFGKMIKATLEEKKKRKY